MIARILIIAGSDSGGGAGIQGDIKTVSALGGYAATAITAITVQNTQGVSEVLRVPQAIVRGQITAVLDDIGADAIKTGMLVDAAMITTVAEVLAPYNLPLVLDPVMVAKGGAALLDHAARDVLISALLPLAHVLTPNVPEAEVLTGQTIASIDDLRRAGETLLRLGARAVVMKGGHLDGALVTDLLITPAGTQAYQHPRQHTRHNHGTGCALASAIATGLAQGMALSDAVHRAGDYVAGAMAHAPGLGTGHGPLGHFWPQP